MATVYPGLRNEPTDPLATQTLRDAGFTTTTDAVGWIAEYSAGHHRVRVESTAAGWRVSHVRIAGSFERVKAEALRDALPEAAQLAVEMATVLNRRLRLIGSVAGPLLAELRRTS